MESNSTEKCILVLAANPIGTDRVELEREAELIRSNLHLEKWGRDYTVRIEQGTQIEDLARYLSEYRPTIVHVIGHGSATGEIVRENDRQQIQPVTPAQIATLFANVEQYIECVVFNSCFSLEMADVLVEYIPCTIGIDEEIHDVNIASFTSEFYRAVAAGKGYYQAFELARTQTQSLQGLEDDLPRLITRDRTLLDIPPYARQRLVRSFSEDLRNSTKTPIPETATIYPVWYGTNRQPIDPTDIKQGFSAERDNLIHYGKCEVSIPESHKIGAAGSSWFKNLLTGKKGKLKLDRQSIQGLISADFWASIEHSLAQAEDEDERIALVFIHGYNVTFDGAAECAAQIGFDLGIPLTAFYSWPSQGTIKGYAADEASIQASEPHILKFLTEFAAVANADRIHIIAHSMGNRGLLRSISKIAEQFQGQNTTPFGQILLAAPDEDPDVFGNLATAYPTIAERTTLYISSKDKALAASGYLHKRNRIGFSPPITIVPGIDTIDVSKTDLSLLGHGYFSADRDVLHDMRHLLSYNTPPGKRFGLKTVPFDTHKYWMFKK
jgi:esterase/lipase superfamily enzyme